MPIDWYDNVYVPRTAPMNHQVDAQIAAYRAPSRPSSGDNFAYLMDMGTGKSKVVLDEWGAGECNDGPPNLLIVAPAGSYRNWIIDKNEIQRAEVNVHLSDDLRERVLVNYWRSGGGKDHHESLRTFLETKGRPRILCVNVEALSTVQKAQDLVEEYLSSAATYFAVDESTTIKGHDSLRGGYIRNLGQMAACRRILTGLLTPRSPLDAWGQFAFLDKRIIGSDSFYGFKRRYAVTKKVYVEAEYDADNQRVEGTGRKVEMVVGYRNIDDLRDRIRPYSFRVLKDDCLDLEPKVFMTRDVKHTKEQARIYNELRTKATAQITRDAHVSVDMIMQLMIRLHQVNLGYVIDEDGNIHDFEEERTDEIIQLIDENRGKVVIWTPFIHRLEVLERKLKKEYGPRAVAKFYGGNRSTRHEDESRFIGDPDCRIMIATQGAGGRGNTWIVANLNIYDSNNYDLEQRQQSEDRTHRKGQNERVTYVDLMTENTVDLRFVHALRNKYDMATKITGENKHAWI
jgi:SNF2 family DNA or RNA helicase